MDVNQYQPSVTLVCLQVVSSVYQSLDQFGIFSSGLESFSRLSSLLNSDPYLVKKENYYLSNNVGVSPITNEQNRTLIEYIKQSKMYANYAAAPYCSDTKLSQWKCSHCIYPTHSVYVFNNEYTETKGYIGINDKEKRIVLGFRGSFNFKNAFSDFDGLGGPFGTNPEFESGKTDYNIASYAKGMYVHRGFLKVAKSLFPKYNKKLEELLNEYKYKDYKLVVTGHSLGAAIASLSSVLIKIYINIPWDRMELFTYGQPRTGFSAYVQLIDQSGMKSIRAVNKNDIIPTLPQLLTGYHHHNRELWAKDANTDVMCSERSTEDPECSVSVYSRSLLNHLYMWDTNFAGVC